MISLRSKAISEVEAATPITCESFHRGDLQKERAVSSQCPRIIKYASPASSHCSGQILTEDLSQTYCQHVVNGYTIRFHVWHYSGVSLESPLPGPSEKATKVFTVPFVVCWLQHGIEA